MGSTEAIIYTDGSCLGNPGPGGWAFVRVASDSSWEGRAGSATATTNNRMELQAAIEALRSIPREQRAVIHTDSSYLCSCFAKRWHEAWVERGWRTASGSWVKNRDLWQQLLELHRGRVTFQWVKAHSGVKYNEIADTLARQAAAQQ